MTSMSNSQSGNSNEASQELPTSKATSSSSAASDSVKLSELLETVPMLRDEQVLNFKPSPTVANSTRVFPVPGASVLHQSVHPASLSASQSSVHDFVPGNMSAQSSTTIPSRGSGIREGSKAWPIDLRGTPGARSDAGTSSAPRAPASRRLSTKRSATKLFTLSQITNILGSTGTQGSAFSSLTNLKAFLSGKNSFEFWMDIPTLLQSKAGLRMHDGLTLFFAPTTTTTSTSDQSSDGDSDWEDSSSSSDGEASIPTYSNDSEESEEEEVPKKRTRRALFSD